MTLATGIKYGSTGIKIEPTGIKMQLLFFSPSEKLTISSF